LVLGRKTYEVFAGYWPRVSDDDPIAATLNREPQYVASRSLNSVAWQNTTILKGEVVEEVARLKREYDEIAVSGRGNLVQTLLRHDLVDRLSLWICPVVLGSGKRLFAGGTVPAVLELVCSTTYGNGAVKLTYERAGKPTSVRPRSTLDGRSCGGLLMVQFVGSRLRLGRLAHSVE
jgi:dihydrofolate reductase